MFSAVGRGLTVCLLVRQGLIVSSAVGRGLNECPLQPASAGLGSPTLPWITWVTAAPQCLHLPNEVAYYIILRAE